MSPLIDSFSAGQIFEYPVHQTWEFTDSQPIRSIFPLWLVYGIPMLLIRWLWVGSGNSDEIPPITIFWTLRVLMFLLSFVLEDWAIQELIQSQRRRQTAVLLVASSYVTWVYQTHTFSNSIETLVVAWSLVLIQRIVKVSVGHMHGVWYPYHLFKSTNHPSFQEATAAIHQLTPTERNSWCGNRLWCI